MEVHLTVDQEALVRQAIKSGRLLRAEEAVEQALSLWEKHERHRVEILAALDQAEADLEAGQYEDYTAETLQHMTEQLKAESKALHDRKPF